MTTHEWWLLVDCAALILVVLMIVLAAVRPANRRFVPGLVLIGFGVTGALLRELGIIPRSLWLEARILYVGIAIVGLVLVERKWAGMRSSGK